LAFGAEIFVGMRLLWKHAAALAALRADGSAQTTNERTLKHFYFLFQIKRRF
jgi:hypothetical protein